MKLLSRIVGAALVTFAFVGAAVAQGSATATQGSATVKFALVDGQSGPNGFIGESMRQHLQFFADRMNAAGGVLGGRKLEVLAFDNKFDPQETIVQLQKAIDAGAQYVFHGNSSAVGAAIVDFLEKHNRRNPEQAVLYINFAALDPVLTNEKCSFWHFRFDADVNIRTAAITNQISEGSFDQEGLSVQPGLFVRQSRPHRCHPDAEGQASGHPGGRRRARFRSRRSRISRRILRNSGRPARMRLFPQTGATISIRS